MPPESITIENARPPFFAGVDVGGTSIKIGIVDDQGRTLCYTSFPMEDQKGPQYSVDRIRDTINDLLHSSSLSADALVGVGLGTPGSMDVKRGYILEPSNIPGWRHFPIRDALAQAVGKSVVYANDANAAAFGEYWAGSGRKYNSIVMLTLGTGVGGGIIIGDVSIDGENSHGSEVGHIPIDFSSTARICSCGKAGHLEAYASATAVVERTTEQIKAGRVSSLSNVLIKNQKLTGLAIAEAAQAGDELAMEIVMETADYLARGVVVLMHTIDPSAVILGGAMNFGGRNHPLGIKFLNRVRQYVDQQAFSILAQRIMIDYAELGGDAGYIGAAGLARAGLAKAGLTQAGLTQAGCQQ